VKNSPKRFIAKVANITQNKKALIPSLFPEYVIFGGFAIK
jgi:hypothetical protein